jgi:hypothetical protein
MEAEEKIEAGPEMSPSAVAAGAIGITVPSKDDGAIDQETALPKATKPKVQPVPVEAEDPKVTKLEAETKLIVKERKAEAKAA